MAAPSEVTDFVKQKLDGIITPLGWTTITHEAYVGVLDNRFSVYSRERCIEDLNLNGFDDFTKYQSLVNIRGTGEDIVFACDTEWETVKTGNTSYRFIISWQFSYIKDEMLTEIIFVAKTVEKLSIQDALSVLYAHYMRNSKPKSIGVKTIRRYLVEHNVNGRLVQEKFKTMKEATEFASTVNVVGKVTPVDNIAKSKYVPICLLFHAGFVDITAFSHKNLVPILKRLTVIQKGLCSLKEIKITAQLKNKKYKTHARVFPFSLIVRDTMCLGPPGSRQLKAYGEAIGFNKVEIGDNIERMGELLINDTKLYFEYASSDSVITLLYAAALYGSGSVPDVTLTSSAANVMLGTLADYLNADSLEEFDAIYRGLKKVDMGKVKVKQSYSGTADMEIPYIQATDYEPLNLDAQIIQYIASKAYHGGYNICTEVGFYDNQTYDYDLKNAYPTAMYPISDIDWKQPIIKMYENALLSDLAPELFEGTSPLQYILAEVDSFTFPQDTPYPCIPLMVKGIPVYPLEYSSSSPECMKVPRVCITGAELFLAHQLGADVKLHKVFILNTLKTTDEDGNTTTSQSLAVAVKQLVSDRARTPKKSLCNTILKVMVNSCYGKIAQNVISKSTWDAYSDEMMEIGPSKISNPVSASFITAIVRCTLIAAQNEITKLGYTIYSVTTDGFISNVPEDILKGLPLHGFRQLLYDARMGLTDGESGEIWEIKHNQSDLLNFNTRGNVSRSLEGVCAHCSARSDYPKDSLEDRTWLMTQVLSRTSKILSATPVWVTFKDFLQGRYNDFDVFKRDRYLSMDYDMKRKPERDSFHTVKPVIEGIEYETANFTTVPYKDVGEFSLYRKLKDLIVKETKKKVSMALRTKYDWDMLFWQTLDRREKRISKGKATTQTSSVGKGKSSNASPDKVNKDKIRYCLYAHYAGVFEIPLLKQSKKSFLAELNNQHLTSYVFKSDDLKNYAKKNRHPKILESKEPDYVKHFLEDQEPITGILSSLGCGCNPNSGNASNHSGNLSQVSQSQS
ncbi:MAG: hypothetical protein IJV92_00050 [Phascolarctobacterium sp.]|nr:hypothetical protein [Phascolarctobacterium sp.]